MSGRSGYINLLLDIAEPLLKELLSNLLIPCLVGPKSQLGVCQVVFQPELKFLCMRYTHLQVTDQITRRVEAIPEVIDIGLHVLDGDPQLINFLVDGI